MLPLTLKIFISSPGDVGQERIMTTRVLERLQGEFAAYVKLEAILWEHEPLRATGHFQTQIMVPSAADVVICILWARLGTLLPADFRREDGSTYASGTEWEFENAAQAYQEKGTPDLLVYRKLADPPLNLSNKDSFHTIEQKKALDGFLDKWFGSPEQGFQAAFHTFATLDEFENRMESHLRRLIKERLPEHVEEERIPVQWHSGSPYRGLETFYFEHANVFFGRTRAIGDVKDLLLRQDAKGNAFLLVFGMSGCGKSSLVRAGFLPTVTQPGVVNGVGLWRWCVYRPSDSSGDLFTGLALALMGGIVELGASGVDGEELAHLLKENPIEAIKLLSRVLNHCVEDAVRRLEFVKRVKIRLALVIDQMEEIFTLERVEATERESFIQVLARLAKSGFVWVIGTMRSDFFHRCAEIPALIELTKGEGHYHLLPPTFTEIGQMIRYSTMAAGLTFEKDPKTGEKLDDLLHEAAAQNPEALPLLEFTLDELYKQKTDQNMLTLKSYQELGGLAGALESRAEEVIAELSSQVQSAIPSVFRALVTIKQGDSEATVSKRALYESLTQDLRNKNLVDALIIARLLVVDRADDAQVVVSVAHEALLHKWSRLQKWLAEDGDFLRIRARVADAAERWEVEEKRSDLLLPEGKPLTEAQYIKNYKGRELDKSLLGYIEASVKRVSLARLRKRFVTVAVFVTISGFAAFSYVQKGVANEKTIIANQERKNAEEGRAEADEQRALADGQTQIAKQERTVAEEQRIIADQERQNAEEKKLEAEEQTKIAEEQTQIAENERVKAVEQTQIAENARAVTEEQRKIADQERQKAEEKKVEAEEQTKIAEEQKQIAENERTVAEEQRTIADQERQNAEDKKVEAEIQKNIAQQQTQIAEQERTVAEQQRTIANKARQTAEEKRVEAEKQKIIAEEQKKIAENAQSEAETQRDLALQSKSIVLAASSRLETDKGATTLGMLLALQALPQNMSQPDRPYVPQAANALYHAVYNSREVADLIGSPVTVETVVNNSREVADLIADHAIVETAANNSREVADLIAEPSIVETAVNKSREVGDLIANPDTVETAVNNNREVANPIVSPETVETAANSSYPVRAAVFSPNGKYIATGSKDQTAQLWDANTHQRLWVLSGHQGTVLNVVFSHDGKLLATISTDGTARIWDVASGKEATPVLKGHTDWLNSAVFSTDDKKLVTTSSDGTAIIWDVLSGSQLKVLSGHVGGANWADFSQDGSSVVVAGEDGLVRIWNAASGETICTLNDHKGNKVTKVVYSHDGKSFVSVGADGNGVIRNIEDDSKVILIGHNARIMDVSFSADNSKIVTGSWDYTAKVWDVATGECRDTLSGHSNYINTVRFSPDDDSGRTVLTTSVDGTARLWDVPKGKGTAILSGHDNIVWNGTFSPDGKAVITAGEDGTARIWTVEPKDIYNVIRRESSLKCAAFSPEQKLVLTAESGGATKLSKISTSAVDRYILLNKTVGVVQSAAFNPDGSRVVIGYDNKTAEVFDTANGSRIDSLVGYQNFVQSVDFSPDGKFVSTAYKGGNAILWTRKLDNNANELYEKTYSLSHSGSINFATFSPDSKFLATAGQDGKVMIWEVNSGKKVGELNRGEAATYIHYSPDGNYLLTTGVGSTAEIWDVISQQKLFALKHQFNVYSADFSPDSKRLVTASQDNTAGLWDVATGTEIAVLRGHGGAVTKAIFSPDGQRVATAGDDGLIFLYNGLTGDQIAVLRGHLDKIIFLGFSSDGESLASGSADGTVRIWQIPQFSTTQDLLNYAHSIVPRELSAQEKNLYLP